MYYSTDYARIHAYLLTQDCPWFRGLHLYVPVIAGATLTAVKILIEGRADVAIAWDGGRYVISAFLHHDQPTDAPYYSGLKDTMRKSRMPQGFAT
jgi:histone deacetylase 8